MGSGSIACSFRAAGHDAEIGGAATASTMGSMPVAKADRAASAGSDSRAPHVLLPVFIVGVREYPLQLPFRR